MTSVFAYHDGPTRELLLSRPALRYLARESGLDLVLGVAAQDRWIVQDLAPAENILTSDWPVSGEGSILSLRSLCPTGNVPVRVAPVQLPGEAVPMDGWWDRAHSMLHQLQEAGIEVLALPDFETVPFFDFAVDCPVTVPERPSIFVDLERWDRDASWFVFDLERMAKVHRKYDFLCTRTPTVKRPNIVDISRTTLAERSKISEFCEILIGRGHVPFVVTFTEANRAKPRAVCGYDAREQDRFWDYPGSPLEYLLSMDDLMDFLAAQERGRCA